MDVLRKRILRADGFPLPIRLDLTIVDAAGDTVNDM
jgi:hypothetical protein